MARPPRPGTNGFRTHRASRTGPKGGTRDVAGGARPGAARSLPRRLIAQVPWVARWTRAPVERVVVPQPRLLLGSLPRKLLGRLRLPPPAAPETATLESLVRRVRSPLAQTARVVEAACELRRPRARWERLREAAALAMSDPTSAVRWERLMGLGLGLARSPAATRRVTRDPASRRGSVKPPRCRRRFCPRADWAGGYCAWAAARLYPQTKPAPGGPGAGCIESGAAENRSAAGTPLSHLATAPGCCRPPRELVCRR